MTEQKVNPLAELRKAAETISNEGLDVLHERLPGAIATVAELVEADKEYDDAYHATVLDPSHETLQRFGKADVRRMRAIASFLEGRS